MSLTDPTLTVPLPPEAGGEADLRFVRTAPRHLVDRSAVAEVLITDWRRLGPDAFRLGAQWPRGHHFYAPVAGAWYDPLLVAESLRQAAILVGQAYYGVPESDRFAMAEMEFEVVPGTILLGTTPAELRIEAAATDLRRRQGRLTAFTLEADLLRGGDLAGAGRLTLHASASRGPAVAEGGGYPPLPEPVPPAIVGRLHEHDVVLGVPRSPRAAGRGLEWDLRMDPGHPVLFDRPAGEVPGMVLVEAARQAIQAACAPYRVLPVELRSAFHFALDPTAPCRVSATRLPAQDAGEGAVVRVAVWQSGRVAFDSLVVATLCD
ncbi:ScbA/BarX family gamma-butyrolactone biosynthesis protein [Streptomyces sp. WMMC940]|uniref:ScbA/BarX family gamma-butyrolactone biosynthesis protein n=1 Tax=Streptomyces sp. WMMC940 TaxID=3015153 RepID=UPI0022B627D9|nr:ScbA/BarX family gamma-butyrolactone biosynthesis protein [Streptomyces sp. WMMC940]MCZ7458922.1 ScbA/BarX family gamma-butyrolactone biosynthesis protein [Streptomyces sp. WMMC940]